MYLQINYFYNINLLLEVIYLPISFDIPLDLDAVLNCLVKLARIKCSSRVEILQIIVALLQNK